MRSEENIIENRKTIYYYDDNDLHVRTTDFDENGKISCDIQYHHNQQKQCDGWHVFDSNNEIIFRYEVSYDEYGREKEFRQFNKRNALETRTINNYDESGCFISETLFDGEGNEISQDEFLEE